ncbi:SDR family NAD(P)-dependent oxidoreductase [Marmoricola sp. RAF53]|uniref:SDR family NAD(P)-dependent oxidoreductase n=1 Tax=Marmoricola sp. RAF53 TaxID=3233059 RepID=UPI003F9BFC8C
MDLTAKYGPWALVVGASDGVGAAFADALAAGGLDVVLLARREAVLAEVAGEIEERHGVRTRVLALDLTRPDAAAAIADAVADLEIGFLVHCAGADPVYRSFLTQPVEVAEAMVHRNCTVLVQLCHRLGGPMAERGRGGIVVFGSGAGFAGAPNMVTYGASKAFDMVFAEALWCELQPRGVDVLGLVLGETDTPGLRTLRHQRGLASGPDEPARGAAKPEAVVAEALARLGRGPVHLAHPQLRIGARIFFPMGRNRLVRLFSKMSARAMGPDPADQPS